MQIDNNKYPGVGEAIDKLVEKYPNWQFEILYTNLDFYTAVQEEYNYADKTANLVYTPTYKGDWIASKPYVNGNWASASLKGIAYFMDIRNFLNEVDIFQFVDLGNYSSSGATLNSIQYQVDGTFLSNYAKDIQKSCENTNINPYYVIARLIQEQGANGSYTINMDGGDGKKYYNPFNINAKVGDEFKTALEKAKNEGWDTMAKGIEGGIKVLKKGYIDIQQNTLYLNKFDVNPASGGGFYNHQYMQNLSAAYSEALIFRGTYVETRTLENTIKFIIPVYENMPETISAKPTGEGEENFDQGPISVKVIDSNIELELREEPSSSGKLIEKLSSGTILLSVKRLLNGWHNVISPSGKIGYCSNLNLQIIDDDANCNDRVIVKTNDGTGVNVRIGPSKSFGVLKGLADGTEGTRIVTNRYYYDNLWWDEVIFDNNVKGFVATNFLKKIN